MKKNQSVSDEYMTVGCSIMTKSISCRPQPRVRAVGGCTLIKI